VTIFLLLGPFRFHLPRCLRVLHRVRRGSRPLLANSCVRIEKYRRAEENHYGGQKKMLSTHLSPRNYVYARPCVNSKTGAPASSVKPNESTLYL
jgi:hypothetical protein